MRRTCSEPRRFPVPMRGRYAGGDLTRSKRLDQPTDRSLMRCEGLPSSLVHAPGLPCAQTARSPRASVAPAIEVGADIKSP